MKTSLSTDICRKFVNGKTIQSTCHGNRMCTFVYDKADELILVREKIIERSASSNNDIVKTTKKYFRKGCSYIEKVSVTRVYDKLKNLVETFQKVVKY